MLYIIWIGAWFLIGYIPWTKIKATMISPSTITTPMNVDGELVECVSSFTHFGYIISADGFIEADITYYIDTAAGALKILSNGL